MKRGKRRKKIEFCLFYVGILFIKNINRNPYRNYESAKIKKEIKEQISNIKIIEKCGNIGLQ